jgi:MarR family transcriptional regulator, transcriptional regulator for hemolysin
MKTEKPICQLMGQVTRLYKSLLFARFKEKDIDITFEQFAILSSLNSGKDFTQQDLANQMHKDKSIILRQINVLIDKKHIKRTRDEQDKRKKTLILTNEGVETLKRTQDLVQEVLDELLQGISQEKLSVFRQVLEKIQENSKPNDSNCQC